MEGSAHAEPFLHPLRAEPVIKFVRLAFGAEESAAIPLPTA